MIKLKTEVNKSAIMRELRKEAESMYDAAYEGEYAIEQFLNGAEALFKKLRIADVVGRSEQCAHPRDKREYIGSNMLRCKICGKEFS